MVLTLVHLLPTSTESVSEKHKKAWEIIFGSRHLVSLKTGFTFCIVSNIKVILSQTGVSHMILPGRDQGPVTQRSSAQADRCLSNLHEYRKTSANFFHFPDFFHVFWYSFKFLYIPITIYFCIRLSCSAFPVIFLLICLLDGSIKPGNSNDQLTVLMLTD